MTMRAVENIRANDELPDPFGETHLLASLPPAQPVGGVAGVAPFIAIAVLLLAVRGVIG